MLGDIAHALFDVIGQLLMAYLSTPASKKGQDAPTYIQKPFTAPTNFNKFSRLRV